MSSNSMTSTLGPRRKGAFGFVKRSDYYLWLLFGSCLFFFSLARLRYIFPEEMRRSLAPGDWFWYSRKYYQLGMQLHLSTVLPCGILSVFQFVPAIRNNYRQIHRINGRVAFTLLYFSIIGALMISPHAIGGAISVQTSSWTLSTMTGYAVFKSWSNIRQRRVGEHRKWALRAMFYMGSIISARVIMITITLISTSLGTYHTLFRCDELEFTMREGNVSDVFSSKYPICRGATAGSVAPVHADIRGTADEVGSALRLSFGAGLWLALMIHAIGVEYYLNLTQPKLKRLANDHNPSLDSVLDGPVVAKRS